MMLDLILTVRSGYDLPHVRILHKTLVYARIYECIQKFPDWPPGARTANGTALCH
jgi:hypothetical protein